VGHTGLSKITINSTKFPDLAAEVCFDMGTALKQQGKWKRHKFICPKSTAIYTTSRIYATAKAWAVAFNWESTNYIEIHLPIKLVSHLYQKQ
jgi:hypothetical protein